MHSHLKDSWIQELKRLVPFEQAPPETEVLLGNGVAHTLGRKTAGASYDPLALLGLIYESLTKKPIFRARAGNPGELYVHDQKRAMAQWLGLAKGLDSSPLIVTAVALHDAGKSGPEIADALVHL